MSLVDSYFYPLQLNQAHLSFKTKLVECKGIEPLAGLDYKSPAAPSTPHRFHIEALGATYKEVRTSEDLESIHGLILPGGESTTMLKLINEFELEDSLKLAFQRIPVWGICAGAILIASILSLTAAVFAARRVRELLVLRLIVWGVLSARVQSHGS